MPVADDLERRPANYLKYTKCRMPKNAAIVAGNKKAASKDRLSELSVNAPSSFLGSYPLRAAVATDTIPPLGIVARFRFLNPHVATTTLATFKAFGCLSLECVCC